MFDGSEKGNLIEDWQGYIPRFNNMVIPARDNSHFFFDAIESWHKQSIWLNIFNSVNTASLVQTH